MQSALESSAEAQQLWARNMAWLVRLRWIAALSQGLTLWVVRELGVNLDVLRLYALVAVTLASNVICALWLRQKPRVREWMIAAVMAFDCLVLTALLQGSGGPSNPFTVLYLVNIALSAVVLKPRYAWILATLSVGGFLSLFLLSADGGMSAMHEHMSHQAAMAMHLRGMWVAFALAAAVIAYSVTRVTRDLETQRQAAVLAHMRAARSERLASLATLAAGAAHELATPLSTIAIAAKELERDLSSLPGAEESAQDAKLIRSEVLRCRHILDQMATDAGESTGEAFASVRASELVRQMTADLDELTRVEVSLEGDPELRVPSRALARALRGLLRNALQASQGAVKVRGRTRSDALLLEIEDRGVGMSPELLARIGEPFVTTKEPGQGMGLGVFLARALCERLGGSLEYESVPSQGTVARVLLPQRKPGADPLRVG